jgi:hypothetical protein
MTIPAPQSPCSSCLADPKRQARGADGAMHAVYCPHNEAGGVYRPGPVKWTVVCPVTADEFADYCARLGAFHVAHIAREASMTPPGDLN